VAHFTPAIPACQRFTPGQYAMAKRYEPNGLKHQVGQLPLFEDERKKLYATEDTTNDRFGRRSVTCRTLLPGKEKTSSGVIPDSWSPDGIKNVDVQ